MMGWGMAGRGAPTRNWGYDRSRLGRIAELRRRLDLVGRHFKCDFALRVAGVEAQ